MYTFLDVYNTTPGIKVPALFHLLYTRVGSVLTYLIDMLDAGSIHEHTLVCSCVVSVIPLVSHQFVIQVYTTRSLS